MRGMVFTFENISRFSTTFHDEIFLSVKRVESLILNVGILRGDKLPVKSEREKVGLKLSTCRM